MWLNEHYCTFPIDSGNQTNRNFPSIEINVRFFVMYFPFFSNVIRQTAILSIMFVGLQVEQNADEEKIIPHFALAVTRLLHIFIVIRVANSLL